jgi:hypothetical protein
MVIGGGGGNNSISVKIAEDLWLRFYGNQSIFSVGSLHYESLNKIIYFSREMSI